jgi:hypothetical protein
MKIEEVKHVVDRIIEKKANADKFSALKKFIDDRTNPQGEVLITVESQTFSVQPGELKALLNRKIQDQDTTSDEDELKQKVSQTKDNG